MPDDQLAFNWDDQPPPGPANAPLPQIAHLADRLGKLAQRGIYLGTSSWKYPGWLGQVYDPSRYETRGKLSQKKFERKCLSEYATIFPTVGGDFSFYQFPSEAYWQRLFGSAPSALQFAFKAPEDITVKVFPKHARYGARAGVVNENFLNAELFAEAFLRPLAPYRSQVAAVIFEFGAFSKSSYPDVGHFAADLDAFLDEFGVVVPHGVDDRLTHLMQERLFEAEFTADPGRAAK